MAELPKYADFAKSYTDLVSSDDYPSSSLNLKVNTVTSNKVKFTVNASQGTAADAPITGDVKAKATVGDVTFTETFSLATPKAPAQLRLQTEYKNLFAKGLKVEGDARVPIANVANTTFETTVGYVQPNFHFQAKANPSTKVAELSIVAGSNKLTFGTSSTLKLGGSPTFVKNSVAASYTALDFDVTGQLTRVGEEYALDAYLTQDVFKNRSLLLGVRAGYKLKEKSTGFEIASSYRLDSATTVRAKAQLDGTVGLGLTHQLREDLKVTVGAETTTKGAKSSVGFTLTFGN